MTDASIAGGRTPTIEAIHRDVAFANTYRLERIKTCLAMATGLLAFTVAFRPSLRVTWYGWLMLVSWLALGVSLVGGVLAMYGWEQLYISYRDKDWKGNASDGEAVRERITRWRRASEFIQIVGLATGVVALAFFSWINLPNVIQKP